MMSRVRNSLGFTLVELLITLSVLALVLSIAVPSFSSFLTGQRIKSTAFDFEATLLLARSEAIKRSGNVDIDATNSAWSNGWQVLSGSTLVLDHQAPASSVSLDSSPSGTTTLTYSKDGRANASLKFEIGPADSSSSVTKRCISIDLSGLPKTATGGCS